MSLSARISWPEAHAEALAHLKRLIQFETINPPGNEQPAAEYLAEALRREGLDPEVIPSAPGRANVVCRLSGSGARPPLLLPGHLDVVPVEPDKWSVPPFAAVEKDGCVWGRGAIDMKNMVAMNLMCVLLLKRSGAALQRDVIFCGVADEEAGGRFGSQFMVENHPDKVRAEYSISEFGGFSNTVDGKRFYLVQVAEKGLCWLRVKTAGEPGHGSVPNPQSAVVKAGDIIARLGHGHLRQRNCDAATRFVGNLSANVKFPKSLILKLLLNPTLSPLVLKIIPDKMQARSFGAMLHDTANPTIMSAGEKINLVPSTATIEIDGRLLPGTSTDDFLAQLRKITGPEAEFEVLRELTPTEAPADDPIFALFAQAILNRDPGAVVTPYLLTGFSDASHWKKLGIKCYGFSPLRVPAEMSVPKMAHGHDERIPIDGFQFGLEALFEVVEKLAVQPA